MLYFNFIVALSRVALVMNDYRVRAANRSVCFPNLNCAICLLLSFSFFFSFVKIFFLDLFMYLFLVELLKDLECWCNYMKPVSLNI